MTTAYISIRLRFFIIGKLEIREIKVLELLKVEVNDYTGYIC